MSAASAIAILVAAFFTAVISGVFGMAGGIVLMGVLAAFLPVSAAMVAHGAIQLVSNAWRAFLLRGHIRWGVMGWYLVGALAALLPLTLLALRPSKPLMYLLLGSVAMLVWLPKQRFELHIERPAHAVGAGLAIQALNNTAGIAGPLLDIFFVRTGWVRQDIVATKAATQAIAHIGKIGFWGAPLWLAAQTPPDALPPLWLLAAAAPVTLLGTYVGTRILERLSDAHFVTMTKQLVTAIGLVYLAWGLWGLAA